MKNINWGRSVLVLVVYIFLAFIFYNNHQNTIQIIKSEYTAKQNLVEKSIYSTIKFADSINQVIEDKLHDEMLAHSLALLAKYRQDPAVSNWQLAVLKEQFGKSDIYIINRDLIITESTVESDVGLDFKNYPSFSKVLRGYLEGGEFVADQMDLSTMTGELMKYTYMPTPDRQYIFELSFNITKNYPVIEGLDVFSVVSNLKNQYPFVDAVTVYRCGETTNGILKLSKEQPYYQRIDDDLIKKYALQALNTNEIQIKTVTDSASKTTCTYKYIPYSYKVKGEISWWNSHVVEIIYNDSAMLKDINREKVFFWESFLTLTAVYVAFIFVIIRLIKKSEYLAFHDPLTALPNRKLFAEFFNLKVSQARRYNKGFAIFFLDINDFKIVNDLHGHKTGDRLLQEIAALLKGNLRQNDIIARWGGDEFAVLLFPLESEQALGNVALKVSNLFVGPLEIPELAAQVFILGVSIGISIYPRDGSSLETLIQKADTAMYYAKKQHLKYAVYSPKMKQQA
ncbi:MAG: GGDEF domain-containing protein [Firmicutes bacterium]|nr:GGDEF domain-containing protein [Bacillota bacterium]